MKNPQTTIALTFLTNIISGIDGVCHTYTGRSPIIFEALRPTLYSTWNV